MGDAPLPWMSDVLKKSCPHVKSIISKMAEIRDSAFVSLAVN